jgi:hypothetical protein
MDEKEERGMGVPEIVGSGLAIMRHPLAYLNLQMLLR